MYAIAIAELFPLSLRATKLSYANCITNGVLLLLDDEFNVEHELCDDIEADDDPWPWASAILVLHRLSQYHRPLYSIGIEATVQTDSAIMAVL